MAEGEPATSAPGGTKKTIPGAGADYAAQVASSVTISAGSTYLSTLAFSSSAVSVAEGGKVSFTVSLSPAATRDVTFSWQTADGTATAGSDYTAQPATDVTISAGSRSVTLEVQTTSDTVVEGDETFTATISASSLPYGVTLGADTTATATITDDDTSTTVDEEYSEYSAGTWYDSVVYDVGVGWVAVAAPAPQVVGG